MFEILKHEKSDEAVRRVIREEIDGTAAVLTGSDLSKDDAVHEARKSMKRIRAALRLVRPQIGEEIFDRENICYRDAARRLAPLRDSAVKVETLDLIRNNYGGQISAESFQTIRNQLEQENQETREKFLRQEDVFPQVVSVLKHGRERVDELPIGLHNFEAYRAGLQKVYRRGRNRMKKAYTSGHSPEKFHDWRKRVKYLWHHIEFFHLLWPAILEPLSIELHQLSDFLGDAHDAAVLEHHLQDNHSRFAAGSDLPLLLDLLSKHRQALELAAHPLGRRIYAEKPAVFVHRIAAYWDIHQQF